MPTSTSGMAIRTTKQHATRAMRIRHLQNKNKKMSQDNYSNFLLPRGAKGLGKKLDVDDHVQTYQSHKELASLIRTIVSAFLWTIPHKDMLSDGWCKDGVETSNNELQVEYRPCGCESMMSKKVDEEDLRYGMAMMDAVPAGCPQRPPAPFDHGRQWQEQHPLVMLHGQPLLELFSLSANFPVNGSITVFDEKGGQVIYENYDRGQGDAHHPPTTRCSNNPEAGFTNLTLTGPHRAISAEGESFAIKLNNPSGPNNDESNGAGELWECNISEAADGIVESVISTEEGEILVTYAVLSNAVEATVQVNLVGFAAHIAHVYGKVTAHIPDFDKEDDILLFSHLAGHPPQRIPSSDATFIVPLSRSIIVVPVSSCIDVVVDIYATFIHQETPPVHFQDKLCFAFGEDTLRIQTAMGDLTVSVDINH